MLHRQTMTILAVVASLSLSTQHLLVGAQPSPTGTAAPNVPDSESSQLETNPSAECADELGAGGSTEFGFSPNGKQVFFTNRELAVTLWQHDRNQSINLGRSHVVEVSPDSQKVLLVDHPSTVKVFDTQGRILKTIHLKTPQNATIDFIRSVHFLSNGQVLAEASIKSKNPDNTVSSGILLRGRL